jgi:hypothetical protein
MLVSSFKTRLLRRLVLKRLTRTVNYEFPDECRYAFYFILPQISFQRFKETLKLISK